MATSNFNVPFNKGQIMFWSWTTQAANQVSVTLSDSATTYINGSRQSTNPLPPPTPGAATVAGSNLKLTINVPNSNQLIPSIASGNITDSSGNVVGEYFNLAIEDGSDGDFNDIWVSLVAWNTGG